jgi:GT2 family glycosyltransferase
MEFQEMAANRFRQVRISSVGKSRAQNLAIADSVGSVLAFFDDDVEVGTDWLCVAADFFHRTAFDAMQGPVLCPTELRDDEAFLRAQYRYRTIHLVQYPDAVTEITTLTGANMAIRREVFSRIGYFNEDLGPGRSGKSEDVEFAARLVGSGGRIGYEPRAVVYHAVDWNRFSESYFRQSHEQQGRSRLLYKKQSMAAIVWDLMRSLFTLGWFSLFGNERRKYRAKGRCFHYRAMLHEKVKGIKRIYH